MIGITGTVDMKKERPTFLDNVEQSARIAAAILIPLILAAGGWFIQDAIEKNKQTTERERNNQEIILKREQTSLEYVKLAKDILANPNTAVPKELVRWSWQLLNEQAPTKFDPDDLKKLIDRQEKLPTPVTFPFQCSLPGNLNGFVIHVQRDHMEQRPGMGFQRSIGSYYATYEGERLPNLGGTTVERQGPGDNGPTGVFQHRRIASCAYPLFSVRTDKYATVGFSEAANLLDRPWPAIGIENTGSRTGIMIHPAMGYVMSIGTINLSKPLADAQSNIEFADSRARVIALINAVKEKLGTVPEGNARIPNAYLVISDEGADVAEAK